MKNETMKRYASIAVIIAAPIVCGVVYLTGCQGERVPTKAEGAAADVKRQSYIDSLNIPASQKAIMKSHMGGPAVQTAEDQARAAAAAKSGPSDRS